MVQQKLQSETELEQKVIANTAKSLQSVVSAAVNVATKNIQKSVAAAKKLAARAYSASKTTLNKMAQQKLQRKRAEQASRLKADLKKSLAGLRNDAAKEVNNKLQKQAQSTNDAMATANDIARQATHEIGELSRQHVKSKQDKRETKPEANIDTSIAKQQPQKNPEITPTITRDTLSALAQEEQIRLALFNPKNRDKVRCTKSKNIEYFNLPGIGSLSREILAKDTDNAVVGLERPILGMIEIVKNAASEVLTERRFNSLGKLISLTSKVYEYYADTPVATSFDTTTPADLSVEEQQIANLSSGAVNKDLMLGFINNELGADFAKELQPAHLEAVTNSMKKTVTGLHEALKTVYFTENELNEIYAATNNIPTADQTKIQSFITSKTNETDNFGVNVIAVRFGNILREFVVYSNYRDCKVEERVVVFKQNTGNNENPYTGEVLLTAVCGENGNYEVQPDSEFVYPPLLSSAPATNTESEIILPPASPTTNDNNVTPVSPAVLIPILPFPLGGNKK
jgi:hypothetical protein